MAGQDSNKTRHEWQKFWDPGKLLTDKEWLKFGNFFATRFGNLFGKLGFTFRKQDIGLRTFPSGLINSKLDEINVTNFR